MKSIILTEKEVRKVLKSGKLKLRKKCSQPVGTIFYVKEAWQSYFPDRVTLNHQRGSRSFGVPRENAKGNYKYFYYKADGELSEHPKYGMPCWRPAREMPFKAARIFLKVAEQGLEKVEKRAIDGCYNSCKK